MGHELRTNYNIGGPRTSELNRLSLPRSVDLSLSRYRNFESSFAKVRAVFNCSYGKGRLCASVTVNNQTRVCCPTLAIE